jgi:hypothetical protein
MSQFHAANRPLISFQDAPATRNDIAILVNYLQDNIAVVHSRPDLVTPNSAVHDASAAGAAQGARRNYTTKHRQPHILQAQAEVRLHALELLGQRNSDVPWTNVPSLREVEHFDRTKGDGPSAEDFRPDLAASLASPWNKRVIQVFAEDFVAKPYFTSKDEALIRKVFKTHLVTLKARYLKAGHADDEPTQEDIDAMKEDARAQRRRAVCACPHRSGCPALIHITVVHSSV